jgi:hypothetical protein
MEKTYYTNGKVTVTNSRFISQDQTYAMSGVTSVKFEETKPNRVLPVVLLIGCLFVVSRMPAASIWLYLGFAAPGLIWLALQNTWYSVTLASASGESRALTSKDQKFIRGVIDAINQAIIERG